MPIALGVVRIDLPDVDRELEGGLLRAGRIELKSPRDATKASADRAHHHVPHREVDLRVRWIDVPEHLFPLCRRLAHRLLLSVQSTSCLRNLFRSPSVACRRPRYAAGRRSSAPTPPRPMFWSASPRRGAGCRSPITLSSCRSLADLRLASGRPTSSRARC